MKSDELLRILRRRANRLGLRHEETPAKGSHIKLHHDTGRTVVPMHRQDLPLGTLKAILRQLGLTEQDLEN